MGEPAVVNNEAESRFELEGGAHGAHLAYRLSDGRIVLVHTEVPKEVSGRGMGGRLVKAAMEHAEQHGLTVVARCPFARTWLERNYPAESYSPG